MHILQLIKNKQGWQKNQQTKNNPALQMQNLQENFYQKHKKPDKKQILS